jgi:hypothetical protein
MNKGSSIQGFSQGMITEIHQHRPKLKDVSTISHVKTNLWGRFLGLKTTSSLTTQYQVREIQQSI